MTRQLFKVVHSLFLNNGKPEDHKEVARMSQEKTYEIMYIMHPELDEESKAALVERFDGILTDNGATIVETKDWGKRKFAYEMNDLREGYYEIKTISSSDSKAIDEFDRLAKINDSMIRHMIVKLDN